MQQKAAWRLGTLSGVMAALWLALALFGASARLHHLLHEDAGAPEHSCAIEHISQGAFFFSPDNYVSIGQSAVITFTHEPVSIVWPARDFRVALSRGPPSLPPFRSVAG